MATLGPWTIDPHLHATDLLEACRINAMRGCTGFINATTRCDKPNLCGSCAARAALVKAGVQ